MKKLAFILLLIYQATAAEAQTKLIYEGNFHNQLDTADWVVEMEAKPGSISTVHTQNGSLILDTKGGVTVWLNKVLSGNVTIEYDRTVLVDTGKNDRLSDFNQFWMARDPNNQHLFTRRGRFDSYDNLELYYVGMGGNTNQTTRFRKYYSGGEKPVIKEYTDAGHLLQANKTYHIKISVNNGTSSYCVNGDCFFEYADPMPLKSGYFGFRSTSSRQEIKNFRVYGLN